MAWCCQSISTKQNLLVTTIDWENWPSTKQLRRWKFTTIIRISRWKTSRVNFFKWEKQCRNLHMRSFVVLRLIFVDRHALTIADRLVTWNVLEWVACTRKAMEGFRIHPIRAWIFYERSCSHWVATAWQLLASDSTNSIVECVAEGKETNGKRSFRTRYSREKRFFAFNEKQ